MYAMCTCARALTVGRAVCRDKCCTTTSLLGDVAHTTVNTPTRHCGLCHTLRAMLRTRSLETALPSGLRPGWYAQLSAISGTVSYQVEWVSHTGTNQHGWAHIQLLSFSST